jgi:hypothetical protein
VSVWKAFFILIVVLGRASAASISEPACDPESSPELQIYVVDHSAAAPATLDAAMVEADRIWDQGGLRLRWSRASSMPSAPDKQSVIVIVRRQLRQASVASEVSASGVAHRPLGWLMFDETGRPGRLIEVSFDGVAALVQKGAHMEIRIADLPDSARDRIVGQGLGRVIAHEIRHRLMGRGHVRTGLMKSTLTTHDLVTPTLPELPAAVSRLLLDRCADVFKPTCQTTIVSALESSRAIDFETTVSDDLECAGRRAADAPPSSASRR